MMPITSRDDSKPAVRVTRDAMLLCLSLLLSYLESFIPLNLIIPLPGFRLGFANIIIMAVFFCVSPLDAAAVSLGRVLITALLFGNPVSFFFSVCGAALAYGGMCLIKYTSEKHFSFCGISVICAALHNTGQIIAAVILFGATPLSYLPVLLIASVFFGGISGGVLSFLMPKLNKVIKRNGS